METLIITSEFASIESDNNRPLVTHKNITHIEASGGLETVLGLFPWSMNELAEYLVNREYMDELMIEIGKLSASKDAA
ncbi:hypothetical protein [Providencia rettgeri]|uniref:hypothetical protein n=1 Tax=Providencia rettgeri TaxID=587 RepID=UPI00294010FE|nr:hypothetical protein [Providencia rettgeri]ELR5224211.1 hypothetical protein [Providencia rettgeri]MDX7324341.1 hypothetical protein [Providencia rettgeri]